MVGRYAAIAVSFWWGLTDLPTDVPFGVPSGDAAPGSGQAHGGL